MRTPIGTTGAELPSPPDSPNEEPRRSPRRARTVIVGGLGLLLAGIGLAAFLLRDDGPEVGGGAVAGSATEGTELAPPTSLNAETKPFAVTLTWTGPRSEVSGYVVYRDGKRIGRVDRDEHRFVDETALPRAQYRYEVEAVAGGQVAASQALAVVTPRAPLGQARVEGLYTIDARDTSHFGFASFPGDLQSGWRFKPRCRTGPCSVTWQDVQGVGISGVLTGRGARYAGSGTTRFATCGNVATSGTITLRLEIIRAASLRGSWRAIKLRGTLVERSPAQLGCVASGAEYDVKATLIA